MANSSRLPKRDKRKLQPISIDELADDSTMRGFSDIFNIPTAPLTHSPTTTVAKTTPGETGPVKIDPLRPRPLETMPLQTGCLEAGPSETVSVETAPLKTRDLETGGETGPPDKLPLVPGFLPRVRQIREAKNVQEGHTYGEQAVYEALWQKGTSLNENVRLLTVGFLKMASIAGLAESNCKSAVAGLIEKLAIEPLSATNISQGRTYRIYHSTTVLARRRAAGLTHVIKSRGVVFVDPSSGRQLTTAKTAPRHRSNAEPSNTTGGETGGPVNN